MNGIRPLTIDNEYIFHFVYIYMASQALSCQDEYLPDHIFLPCSFNFQKKYISWWQSTSEAIYMQTKLVKQNHSTYIHALSVNGLPCIFFRFFFFFNPFKMPLPQVYISKYGTSVLVKQPLPSYKRHIYTITLLTCDPSPIQYDKIGNLFFLFNKKLFKTISFEKFMINRKLSYNFLISNSNILFNTAHIITE